MSSKQSLLTSEPSMAGKTVEDMNMERDAETDRRIGQVFRTMLFFTLLMVLGPILTYFYSRTYVFEGNSNTNNQLSPQSKSFQIQQVSQNEV